MGKSLTAILYGVLLHQEGRRFDPLLPAPIPEWQEEGDPRAGIRVGDLLRMSSGLEFSSLADPRDTWRHGHPDHFYIYSGAIDVFAYAASRPLQHRPATVGRYRNCDPLLVGYLIRRAVEARGESYLAFPRRALFDKIGVRRLVLEPDPWGNFVMTGFEYGTARDWARLGLLLLQDGMFEGRRLLPEGFVDFVSAPAPAWKDPVYGGLFWVDGGGRWSVPPGTYSMAGHGGQFVILIPSHDLVVVRMGHQKGGRWVDEVLDEVLGMIVRAAGGQAERSGETGGDDVAELPRVVDPGPPGGPPSDAIVLFDGTDLSEWRGARGEPEWTIEDGVLTIVPGTGNLTTRRSFGDCQLHIEWRVPSEEGSGQSRGNSGIKLHEAYEIQILDSYGTATDPKGQAAAVYAQHAPLVNACRPPGEWQAYDIVFRAPRFDGSGRLLRRGTFTVFHNGVLVHEKVEILGRTNSTEPVRPESRQPLFLQDHGSRVGFRNIWIREL